MVSSSAERMLRPAWWGFFVSAVGVLLLLLAQQLWRSHIESDWPALKTQRQNQIAADIESRFHDLTEEQRRLAQLVLHDDEIMHAVGQGRPSMLATAFQRLQQLQGESERSIDIVDSLGVIRVWAGRSVVPDYSSRLRDHGSGILMFVSQASLHRYLTVGIPSSAGRTLYVFVSSPLETNYPVSNRFVSRRSFADVLSTDMGVSVQFETIVSPRDTAGESVFAVPLRDSDQNILTHALVPLPTLATESMGADRLADSARSIFGAAAMAFLALALLGWKWLRNRPALRTIVSIILLWGVRIGWRTVAFPSLFVGGFLFDPAVCASPFPLGLAGSLGEVVLSDLALFITMLVLLRKTLEWSATPRWVQPSGSAWKRYARFGGGVLLALMFQGFVRGYGAAIRSFVFDSTIRYQDPMSLVPNLPMIVMHLNILVMTVALVAASIAVILLVTRMFVTREGGGVPGAGTIVIVACIFLLSYGTYLLADWPPQLPVYVPLVLYGLSLAFVYFWFRSRADWTFWRSRPLAFTSLLMAAAFILSAMSLDSKMHEKERERVQILAEEHLRPVDNWLSLVLSESLRSSTSRAAGQLVVDRFDSTSSEDLAFSLWAQTLLSKEGYNSAVVVYDAYGKELSRFSVGLTSYEQMELLSQVFHKEEEALLVVDRKVADGTIKYYGEWRSVLGPQDEPLGTIAVLMSASQRNLFRGEAPEQLRAASNDEFEDAFRKISISEYHDGMLWSTNDPVLYRGIHLAPSIEEELNRSRGRFVWSTQVLEGRTYHVLYARDDVDRSRVISLSLPSLDLRWHLFNLVKALQVYLLFLGAVALGLLVRFRMKHGHLRFGFREKLITSFAILSILPLILMAYYDRQLADERLDENTTNRLSQDLDVIQQRLSGSVTDEQDFAEGVNNDYCEVAASDLGVDFSVYEGRNLKASSRPELYRASILDRRLTGTAYVNVVILGRGFYKTQEQIGEVSYVVGYRPIVLGDTVRGVLAVPALYQQQQIDEELAQRNAFVLGAYALVVSLVIGLGIALANALSKPLRDLSKAAQSVGRGNLDVVLEARSADEVGDLIRSFNEMTSELKASRNNLARAERELAWKEMAKQVAHEIKNPLTPMKLSMQHLVQAYRQGAKDFGDILQRVSQTVVEQIEVLARIATEFSNFARMPERKFERVDLKQLVADTINLFKEVRGIEFRASITEEQAFVVADQDELRRVLLNIFRNSVQAMEGGGTITIQLSVDRQLCTIRISDTGSGIPDEIQSRVFQPNFSTKTDGMGLGLAIARKVIEDLNGTIVLKSQVGKGTTIEMKIPLGYS